MKAVVIERAGKTVFTEKPIPEPEKGFARIKVAAAAVCATDLEVVDGNIPASYPLTPGHEWAGTVDAVGDEADSEWLGKRVIGSNDVVCLKCDACRSGNWRYCKSFKETGFKRDGAYAEYFTVPVYGLYEIPDSLPFDLAALNEPLGVALGTMEKSGADFGQTALIFGAGSIGLCALAVAKAMGLKDIAVVATTKGRLDIAKKLGADKVIATKEEDLFQVMNEYRPEGTDIIIDATGIEECIVNSLKLAKKGGTVVLVGYGRGREMKIRVDDIHINNLKVVGAGNNWNMHKKAADLLASGKIDLTPLITDKFELKDYEKALDMARNRPNGFVKAVFEL